MLGEEEELFEDLTSHSSERRSDRYGRAARSGSGGDLSSDESEFLHKRNSKEDREWMRRRVMKLSTSFIGRREGIWYSGGETVNGE
jgi:hypothetical protein